MTTISSIVYSRCTTFAGLVAYTSTRVTPHKIPAKPEYPLLVYISPVDMDDTQFRSRRTGGTEHEEVTVQITVYSTDYDECESIAKEVKKAWNGYSSGCVVAYSWIAGESAVYSDDFNVFSVDIDVTIGHRKD